MRRPTATCRRSCWPRSAVRGRTTGRSGAAASSSFTSSNARTTAGCSTSSPGWTSMPPGRRAWPSCWTSCTTTARTAPTPGSPSCGSSDVAVRPVEQRTPVRDTGIALTAVSLGGAQVGNLYRPTSEQGARDAVDAAWEAGVRYFDTAPHYGLGLSERRVGAALRERPRDAFVLSTKVGRLLEPVRGATGFVHDSDEH